MDPAGRAVVVGRPVHVLLVVIEASSRVVAGWEVDISSERGGVPITILVGKPYTSASIVRILNTNTVQAVRVRWVQWLRSVGTRAGELDWLRNPLRVIEDASTTCGWRSTKTDIANDHVQANRESLHLIIGLLKEVVDVHVERWNGGQTAVAPIKPQRWGPVGRVVVLDEGGGTFRTDESIVSQGHSEVAASLDGVDMAGFDTW